MISFKLDRHEHALKEEFRFIGANLLRPYAAEADRIAGLPEGLLARPELTMLMRAFVPDEFGGGWQGLLDPNHSYNVENMARMRVLACEEGGCADPSLFISLPGPGLAYPAFRAQGSPAQQKRFFESFMGDTLKWAAFAVSEPKAGSDVAAISTTARLEAGHYVINGIKWFIGNGARADWIIVFATVDPTRGQFGVRTFIVERGTPGFRVGRILPTMGMKAVQLSELIFEDCKVSEENMLGHEKSGIKDRGFQAGTHTFTLVRPGIAAMAVGVGRSALERTEEIVAQNGARHALAHKWRATIEDLRSMKMRLEGARLLCWSAACLADSGKDNSRVVSMAKALSARIAMDLCSRSMVIAAHAGVSDLTDLDRLFRNVKVFDILEGTGDMQRLMIARSLVRALGEPENLRHRLSKQRGRDDVRSIKA
jgi:acyl-CoA dehydrogenase